MDFSRTYRNVDGHRPESDIAQIVMTTFATTISTSDSRISPRRRRSVLAVLFVWLTWTFACPQAMVGVDGLVSGSPQQVVQVLANHGTHGDEDVCCTALQHLSTVLQKDDFKTPVTVLVFHALLPTIPSLIDAVLAATRSEYRFSYGSPPTRRHSPALGGVWPHAPPR